jgi:hypothetical protein
MFEEFVETELQITYVELEGVSLRESIQGSERVSGVDLAGEVTEFLLEMAGLGLTCTTLPLT